MKTTRFNIPYVTRKNIVINVARELKLPSNKAANIIAPVNIIAFLGSEDSLLLLNSLLNGIVLCWANACNIRGAPTILPNAEEKVAANIPIITIGPHNALSTIII